MTEKDERVQDYQKINYGNYIVKLKDDEVLQDEVEKINTMPLHLGAFVLSNSKRIMNNFIHAIDGFIVMMYIILIVIVCILKRNIGKN